VAYDAEPVACEVTAELSAEPAEKFMTAA